MDRWNELLMLRLDNTKVSVKDSAKVERRANRLQKELHYDLISFTQTQILYTMKRLLAADLKTLYVGTDHHLHDQDDAVSQDNPFWSEFQAVAHERKGGFQVAEFLVYGW